MAIPRDVLSCRDCNDRRHCLLTEVEKAYLAGIVDGEGTVTLTRHHKNRTPSPQVSVSNNDLELLEYIRDITNCGQIRAKKKSKPHHHQSWHWQVNSVSDILRILEQLYPFLRVKKLQAGLILKHYKEVTPRNGRYSLELLERKRRLVETVQGLNRGKSKSSIIRQAPSWMDEDIVHAFGKPKD